MKKTALFFTFLFIFASIPLSGIADESSNWEGAFANLGVGARALGMGGAFTAIADDASSTYWNPAGLGFMMQRHVTFMYTDLYGLGLINDGYVSYGHPDDGNGAAGFSWFVRRIDGLKKRKLKLSDDDKPYSEKTYNENTFTGSYARRITDYVSAGVSLKFLLVSSDFDDLGGKGYGCDAGVTVYPDKRLGLSFVIKDLFTQVNWDNDDSERSPIKFTSGLVFAPARFIKIAGDISGSEENVIKKVASGVESNIPIAGLEESLTLRAGLIRHLDIKQRFVYTAGMSVGFGMGSLDYAFMLDDDSSLNNTHFISANIYWE